MNSVKEIIIKIRHFESCVNRNGLIGYTSEDAFLAHCMEWLRAKYPNLIDYVFHIANEGSSSSEESRRAGAKNLTKGVLSGVPDVCSMWNGVCRWCEFKIQNRPLKPRQEKIAEKWGRFGVKIPVIQTFNEWVDWIENVVLDLNFEF